MRSLWAVAGLGGLAVVLLVRPACPVYESLHVLCPGCGATRAMMALLRGDVATAWRMNALFCCALPVMVVYAARAWRLRSLKVPVGMVWASLGVVIAFGVMRNF